MILGYFLAGEAEGLAEALVRFSLLMRNATESVSLCARMKSWLRLWKWKRRFKRC
jgi:hypothetical protein